MASIKIKHFGPIKEGYSENDGFIPIQKVMAFIGNQGSGKSSVVKLISTFSWIEKALVQKKETINSINDNIADFWANQGIELYFKENTLLEYKGEAYSFKLKNGVFDVEEKDIDKYTIPKISFIPAERNLISVLEQAQEMKLPYTLSWCLYEFANACKKYSAEFIDLPIKGNNIRFWYNDLNKTAFIRGYDYALPLANASSGIQSLTPLYVVLHYLNDFIQNENTKRTRISNVKERKKLEDEVAEVKAKKHSYDIEFIELEKVYSKYRINHLVNILEEIEQNLFPDSQREVLNKILEFTNNIADNKLIITTHSPYIISYLTLAMEAYLVNETINGNSELKERLKKIVPIKSCIDPNDVGAYQLDLNGNIHRLPNEYGIITDNNELNNIMADTNMFFNQLLEIKEEA